MKIPLMLAKAGALTFYYSSAALAFATPDIRVTNAALGLVGGIWIGKRVAGAAALLASKNKQNENKDEVGLKEKGALKSFFQNAKGPVLATTLLGATALATGYVGANTIHDVKYTGRTAIWAFTGNVIDAAYKVARPVLNTSADFGQAVTQNINPLPEDIKEIQMLQNYGKQLDGLAMCFDRVITNEPSFAGTCGDKIKTVINPIFDRK